MHTEQHQSKAVHTKRDGLQDRLFVFWVDFLSHIRVNEAWRNCIADDLAGRIFSGNALGETNHAGLHVPVLIRQLHSMALHGCTQGYER